MSDVIAPDTGTIADDFVSMWDTHRAEVAHFINMNLYWETVQTKEDLLQDVFLRVWSAMCRGMGPTIHQRGWLFRVARNIIIDYTRPKKNKTVPVELDAGVFDGKDELGLNHRVKEKVGERLIVEGDSVHEMVEQSMEQEDMRRVARRLTPGQEKVVLGMMDGYGYAEIAEGMGTNTSAVKQLKLRACNDMRRYLGA